MSAPAGPSSRLSLATGITLIMVPVIYAMFVRDLKIVKWDTEPSRPETIAAEPALA